MSNLTLGTRVRGERRVLALLQDLVERSGSLRSPLQSIGERLRFSTDERFRAQEDPQGQPWEPLAASTKARKKTPCILQESGTLRDSVFFELRGDDAVAVASNLVYAPSHQFGRDPYVIRPRNKKALWWPGLPHPVSQVNHPGLPARPFLGISDDDEAEAVEIVRDHLLGR